MPPSMASPASGGMEKVTGISSATPIVLVKPGSMPMNKPNTTPNSTDSNM